MTNITPTRFEENALALFVSLLCSPFDEDHIVHNRPTSNLFLLENYNPISLKQYSRRLAKYFECSDHAFIVAAIYIQRASSSRADLFTKKRIHKLLAISLVLATKFTDDVHHNQTFYAATCGIDIEELNQLESSFLELIGFKCFISEEEFLCSSIYLRYLQQVAFPIRK
eukprot:c22228_g1_i1.p1 GENE.c22228_g1_i1~~c22228_g1_i1.p1  ORF type:complete len:169 (-),score=24.12 c22228_g1_i1:97-603(-)